MNVQCPHCSTAYLLPEALLGAKGARVRCPKCQGAFVALRDGDGLRIEAAPVTPSAAHASGSTEAAGPAPVASEAPAPVSSATTPTPPPPSAQTSESPEASTPSRPLRHVPVESIQAAERVLDELSAKLGEPLTAALAEGRALSEFGPTVMDAYADYRKRMGAGASAEAFREALRSRWSLDLTPRADASR